MQQALYEARERQPGFQFLLSLLLHEALIEFFRAISESTLDLPTREASSALESTPLRQAVEILRAEHDQPDLQMLDVAQRVGFTLIHFSRRFKEELGVTPGQYVRHLRLSHAVPLLLRTDLTLEAIAYLSGFGSARRLAEASKDAYGCTPREIRTAGGNQAELVDRLAQKRAHG